MSFDLRTSIFPYRLHGGHVDGAFGGAGGSKVLPPKVGTFFISVKMFSLIRSHWNTRPAATWNCSNCRNCC
jgi:hypothetical protein